MRWRVLVLAILASTINSAMYPVKGKTLFPVDPSSSVNEALLDVGANVLVFNSIADPALILSDDRLAAVALPGSPIWDRITAAFAGIASSAETLAAADSPLTPF